jgi:DNA-binding NarL/FixJ family response regulator/predicted negative regulator of RcsB-dependent stress response
VSTPFDASIGQGEAALRAGDRTTARLAFEAALAERVSGTALEGLAHAAYLDVDYPGAIASYEHAFTAYRDEGNVIAAARSARTIAYLCVVHGDFAVMGGWVARAKSILDDAGELGAERAWVDVFLAFSEPNVVAREQLLRDAVAAGRRLGDRDLEFDALSLVGQLLVETGRLDEGMALQDEALAAACAGEVQRFFVVEGIFCTMFTSCERAHDVGRAEQWIRAADDIVRLRGLTSLAAFCRAHYGGILTAAGRWSEAEAELEEAARIFASGRTVTQSNASVRLAELRVRQGRYEDAQRLLDGLDQHPDAPRPLAALHLARGETMLARDRLEQTLGDQHTPAAVAGSLLSLLVDVHLAGGEIDAAASAADRLVAVAAEQGTEYLRAAAAFAMGLVATARTADGASRLLREALAGFARAQMPLEVARARLALARALATERPEVAIAEAKTALDAFERLEAARLVDEAAALLRTLGAPLRVGVKGRGTLTKREAEILDLLGHGLSNKEMAERLVISPKTVEHHVGRILAKLGLRRRAEATAYANRAAPSAPR